MIGHILLAFDGSEPSLKALALALELARRHQARLLVLTVAEVPEFPEEVETVALVEQSRAYHQRLLDGVRERLRSSDVRCEFHLVVGHPARQILAEAERRGIDLIVLGHRGHGMLDRWRLGSVTHRVISYAECAVTVVR